MQYKVYASICDVDESYKVLLHNKSSIAGEVKAKTIKAAMQKFYDGEVCQKFIDENIDLNTIHFYFELLNDRLCYYYRWIEV